MSWPLICVSYSHGIERGDSAQFVQDDTDITLAYRGRANRLRRNLRSAARPTLPLAGALRLPALMVGPQIPAGSGSGAQKEDQDNADAQPRPTNHAGLPRHGCRLDLGIVPVDPFVHWLSSNPALSFEVPGMGQARMDKGPLLSGTTLASYAVT